MKKVLLLPLIILALASKGFAQIANDYVAAGRALMTVSNIPAANTFFTMATVMEPTHQEANILLAVTRLLVLPSQQGGSNLLSELGIPMDGRSIYKWTASPSTDGNGIPLVPVDVSTTKPFDYIRTTFLPTLHSSLLNLSRVTDPAFTLHLNKNETKISDVTLDYGDVLMLESLLHALKFGTLTMTAHNWEAQLSTLRSLYTGNLSVESFLASHPNFLTFADVDDLFEARTAYQQTVDSYLLASEFIRNRPVDQIRLFNHDIASADDEKTFRDALTSIRASLNGAAVLATDTNYIVNMGAYYSGAKAIREFLPIYRGNSFILGTLKDLTFGNTILGLDQSDLENYLARIFKTIPNISTVGMNQNVFHFQIHVLEDSEYVVQMSSNLQSWTDTEYLTVPGGIMIIQDDADQQFRFYRILDLSSLVSIQGTVINRSTGSPIPGAHVSTSLDTTSAFTDGQGKFSIQTRIPAEPENEYFTIRITAPGLQTYERSQSWGTKVRGQIFYLSEGPINDYFADRKTILTTDTGVNITATKEIGEPWHWPFTGGKSVWWSWQCTSSGPVSIGTEGSSFDTIMSVYTGTSLPSLIRIASDDDGGDTFLSSRVAFNAQAGQTYQIAVDGFGGDFGHISLQVNR